MKLALRLRSALLVSAACAGFAVPGQAQAAGLFEFLFGGSGFEQPQPRYHYHAPPIDVRVNPRRRDRGVGERRVRSERRAPRAAEKKVALAKPIDPVKNPTWYLDDPTLKRGDIVVLKGQVLVYDGGRGERAREDFTRLEDSRLISRGERERVRKSAGIDPGAPEPATPTAKQAALVAPE